MHLARDWPDHIGDRGLECLIAASEDRDWIWSCKDDYSGWSSRDEALNVLARFADRPVVAEALRRAGSRMQIESESDHSEDGVQ